MIPLNICPVAADMPGFKAPRARVQIYTTSEVSNQTFGAIKEVKILNKEKHVEEIFKQNFGELEKNIFVRYFFNSIPRLFLEVICVMAVVVISTMFVFMEKSTASIIPIISLLAVSIVRILPAFNTISSSLVAIKTVTPQFNYVSKTISELKNVNIVLDQAKEKEIKRAS